MGIISGSPRCENPLSLTMPWSGQLQAERVSWESFFLYCCLLNLSQGTETGTEFPHLCRRWESSTEKMLIVDWSFYRILPGWWCWFVSFWDDLFFSFDWDGVSGDNLFDRTLRRLYCWGLICVKTLSGSLARIGSWCMH